MNNKYYEVLASKWFTSVDGCIGVVAVETFTNEWKAYIGIADGYNQQGDEQHIAMYGSGLLPEEAHGFFPHLNIEKYKY